MGNPHPQGSGLLHGLAVVDSDEAFLRACAPICEEGIAAREPVVVRVTSRRQHLLRAALSDPDRAIFLDHGGQYGDPPSALAATAELVDRHTCGGSAPARLIGEVPAAPGLSPDMWLRYEAACSHTLARYPLQAWCVYDTGSTPPAMLASLPDAHDAVATEAGLQPNHRYQHPHAFLADRPRLRDPLEASPPALDLADPAPADVRQRVGTLARRAGIADEDTIEGLVLAADEALSNAIVHGRPPVSVRAWYRPGRVVVAISDTGPGPDDPFAGLFPSRHPGSGHGLWLAHRLCPEVAMADSPDGFTVRLAVGEET